MNTTTKRDTARKALKRHLISSKKAESLDEAEIDVYISLINEHWEKFQKAQDEVEFSCGADTLPDQEPEREQGEVWYREAITNFTRARNKIIKENALSNTKNEENAEVNQVQHAARPDIRLPPMKLPSFDGNSKEWKPFEDAFTAIVHSESSISSVQKLHFLLSSLQGQALNLVKGFRITDNNYDEVWDLLKNRYDSTRIIVDSHFQALFSIRKLNAESSTAIRSLLDEIQEHYRSLKAIGRPVINWDDWLVHLTISKLDTETHKQWELTQTENKVATFTELVSFMENRCRSLDAVISHQQAGNFNTKNPTSQQAKNKKSNSLHTTSSTKNVEVRPFRRQSREHVCLYCAGKHLIFSCDKFRSTGVEERVAFVCNSNLCYNCLSAGHNQSSCQSKGTCRLCQTRHHTLLHRELPSGYNSTHQTQNNATRAPAFTPSYTSNSKQHILLGTAMVQVMDSSQRLQPARLLFDSGSHSSFISESCVQRLRLKRTSVTTAIEGIGATAVGSSKGEVELNITSFDGKFCTSIHAQILNKITSHLPPVQVQNCNWPHINGLSLADPCFNIPAAIDLLIGADELCQFLCTGLIKGPIGTPIAQKSNLGWVLMGKVTESIPVPTYSASSMCLFTDTALTKAVSRFWEIETLPKVKNLTLEEKLCEKHYEETHHRQKDGRFVVQLPFKIDCQLGSSRNSAIRALIRMERQFAKDKDLCSNYKDFIHEFIELGHMEEVVQQPLPANHYYMPHRAVVKETSTTTKLRVVFNASCPTSSGLSLNDTQMLGPQLQPDLFLILLRLRSHRFALSADVAKMYRQVRIDKKHVDFQRIVWRDSPTEEIRDYRLLTVTYGVSSASYLAVKSLQKAATATISNSLATEVILRDFYMDDLLTGCFEEDDLHRLQVEVSNILRGSGFDLRKWSSNSPAVINAIPEDQRETMRSLNFDETDAVRTLGLQWVPSLDHLSFSVQVNEILNTNLTKRFILSDTAKLFDPLGLLSPSTIIPKMLLQSLWRPKVDWDETVPDDIRCKWLEYRDHITHLAAVKVPRWVGTGIPKAVTDLHGFADASQSAYAAAIYVRTLAPDGSISSYLLTAKTRVAPLKTLSLPRLELCGAVLLAQLLDRAQTSLTPHIHKVYGWTDSTIALAWIRQQPSKWSTFVANRVTEIQEVVPSENWFHVRSSENPADCATRGVLPHKLMQHPLWWKGPSWLEKDESNWPTQHLFTTALEQRAQSANSATINEESLIWQLITQYSSLRKLKRTVGYILRYINNLRHAAKIRKGEISTLPNTSTHLHLFELNKALDVLLRCTQEYYFAYELQKLKQGKPVSRRSRLLTLHPFLDEKQFIRVGGRLRNSLLQLDKRHPIVLPAESRLALLICEDIHSFTLHAGPQAMLVTLQSRYWVLGARKIVRSVYKKCVKCRRYNAKVPQQMMGDLPWPRVQACRPFLRSGVDFAGPVQLRFSKGRGAKSIKGYISIFVCMSTGAMHLELASDLSSATFIAVFKRFVSRRGHCKELFSDNGTNFVGADKELKMLLTKAMQNECLIKHLSNDGTIWHFNPPAAPHMGGFWETAVKRVKFHLRRALGATLLTYEEFTTLLTEIEACVNSRPLCPSSSDVDDLSALTPGHFLIGEPLKTIPEPVFEEFKGNLVSRWHLISSLRQHFWKRWSSEYLVHLQQRSKWQHGSPNLNVGDLVLIRDEQLPPTKWKLARITQLHPGPDNRVRVVTMKTADGVIMRPIVKVSPLSPIIDINNHE